MAVPRIAGFEFLARPIETAEPLSRRGAQRAYAR